MTYSFFKNNACTPGTAFTTETITVAANGSVPASSATGALANGSYAFQAAYSGNGNYNTATTECEPFTVNKATPSITTELHSGATDGATPSVIAVGSSIDLNSSVHDSATVTNGGFAFTGTATFEFFKNKTCTGTPDDSATLVALVSGVADPALAKSNLASGDYAYQAMYVAGSDPNHNDSAWSSCEWFHVNKATPTISTTLKNAATDATIPNGTALALGTSVYDTSAFTNLVGAFSPNGTATVTYSFFKNSACTPGTAFSTETVTVAADGSVPASSATGALATGSYAFQAAYSGNGNYNTATSECEPFSVNKATPSITTELHSGATDGATPSVIAVGSSIDLNSSVHDSATVTNGGFAFTGTATFEFFKNKTCTGTPDDSATLVALVSGVADPALAKSNLASGDYAYHAMYVAGSDPNHNDSAWSSCEWFHVNKAPTTTTTQVHDADHDDITNTVVYIGIVVHDSASVSGQVGAIAITGNVTYSFFKNSTCTGTPAQTWTVAVGTESPAQTITSLGDYCYKAEYLGDANYASSVSAIEPFRVLPHSLFTDTMLCTLTNNQFKLVYTPDQTNGWKLNASNPGQYYYNMFYTGAGNEDIELTLPYPWVTQGAVPIHVYSDVGVSTTNGTTCLTPIGELANSTTHVTLANYGDGTTPSYDFSKTTTVTIHVPALSGGFAYVNIHLDYGLKGTTGYAKGGSGNDAVRLNTSTVLIPDLKTYAFSDTTNGTTTVTSINTFKKDPGIGGLVLNGTGDPVKNAKVDIYQGTSTKATATVYTDEDGWYMWQYKWTGKAATFNVKMTPPLPYHQTTQTATVSLKANGYLIVSFTVLN